MRSNLKFCHNPTKKMKNNKYKLSQISAIELMIIIITLEILKKVHIVNLINDIKLIEFKLNVWFEFDFCSKFSFLIII